MKFIYHGLPSKSIDLVWAGIFKPTDVMVEGTTFEIPDDNVQLINRVKVNGAFEEYVEPKKAAKPKKTLEKEEED